MAKNKEVSENPAPENKEKDDKTGKIPVFYPREGKTVFQ